MNYLNKLYSIKLKPIDVKYSYTLDHRTLEVTLARLFRVFARRLELFFGQKKGV